MIIKCSGFQRVPSVTSLSLSLCPPSFLQTLLVNLSHQRPPPPSMEPPPSQSHDHQCNQGRPTLPSRASTLPTTGACCKCGGPTTFGAPLPNPFPSPSDLPAYRPIRYPAINVAPDVASRTQQTIMLTPVPQPQHVPILSPPYGFETSVKRITSPSDAKRFVDSETGKSYLGFIAALSHSFRGRKISDPCHESETISRIMSLIDTMSKWVDEIPPAAQSSRYGNLSYRVWHEKMCDSAEGFMLEILPKDDQEIRASTIELVPYFTDSFGNATRIDYGTGHEANFAAWLYCLARLGLIKEEDYQTVVARIFVKYLELMRKLQLVYCLEPAGSHGVWGLDDYHFLPFVFGSAQLIDHKYMKPKSIHNEDILENFSKEYLYLSCIAFIRKVKKGPFAEHSPLLDDISGVPTWTKVNSGMLKMYRAEVLEKVPVVQHFLFGSIIKWE